MVIFSQKYEPGQHGLSDFTHMGALGVTVPGRRLSPYGFLCVWGLRMSWHVIRWRNDGEVESMGGTGQLGFAVAFMSAGLGTNRKLERLDALIDWSALEGLASGVRAGRRGRPPYAPLSMLKALYLQALYDLSDPGLEEALLDRLSFRRFCGFALYGGTPDETTICRFRADAGAVLEAAFEEINRQLDAAGLIAARRSRWDGLSSRSSRYT